MRVALLFSLGFRDLLLLRAATVTWWFRSVTSGVTKYEAKAAARYSATLLLDAICGEGVGKSNLG